MKTQRLTTILTLLQLTILLFYLVGIHPVNTAGGTGLLKGSALEIVDDSGRTRAQLAVLPASVMPDGRTYPQTTLFRLIDTNGRPAVKIGASMDGSAMSMAGDSERTAWSGVQILAQGPDNAIILTNRSAPPRTVTP